MDVRAFVASVDADAPPADAGRALQALWHAAKGDWDTAHGLAQAQDDKNGAWVHAYLHRLEGNESNAAYWYRRAGQPVSNASLREEWTTIARALLSDR